MASPEAMKIHLGSLERNGNGGGVGWEGVMNRKPSANQKPTRRYDVLGWSGGGEQPQNGRKNIEFETFVLHNKNVFDSPPPVGDVKLF